MREGNTNKNDKAQHSKNSNLNPNYRPYKIRHWKGHGKQNIDDLFDEKEINRVLGQNPKDKKNDDDYVKKEDEGNKPEEYLDNYFKSYSGFGIHEDMLRDKVRTKTYMNAIRKNDRLFRGKIVLDIGCGTGILSMFAAKAGAEHVYGIEMADIHKSATKIVKENGFEDKITIINGKVEDVVLPVDKVDIIISEWMGYFLLYEGMLDTVLHARDKWLKPDGLLFPDRAVLYLTGIEDEEYKKEKFGFWDDVYGYKMTCLKKWAKMDPLVDHVEFKAVITSDCPVLDIDLQTCTVADLDFSSEFI